MDVLAGSWHKEPEARLQPGHPSAKGKHLSCPASAAPIPPLVLIDLQVGNATSRLHSGKQTLELLVSDPLCFQLERSCHNATIIITTAYNHMVWGQNRGTVG